MRYADMFTIEFREYIHERILEFAKADKRISQAALVGSTSETPDRWSDLDITFGVSSKSNIEDVLRDWTSHFEFVFNGVSLFDITYKSSVYMVFILPGGLQVDISFTPESDFGPHGPRFRLLYGNVNKRILHEEPDPKRMFGMAVHHLLRTRVCLERRKIWQAEYWLSSARNEFLSIICINHKLPYSNGKGYDKMPKEVVDSFTPAFPKSLNGIELCMALKILIENIPNNKEFSLFLTQRLENILKELISS